jgi:hypothetical protein
MHGELHGRETQFVNAMDWLWGSLEGGLQGGVARFASEQRLLTKWTAVDQSCGTTPRKHKITAVDDYTVERLDEKAKENRIRIRTIMIRFFVSSLNSLDVLSGPSSVE